MDLCWPTEMAPSKNGALETTAAFAVTFDESFVADRTLSMPRCDPVGSVPAMTRRWRRWVVIGDCSSSSDLISSNPAIVLTDVATVEVTMSTLDTAAALPLCRA